jgi:hypothetical protein
MVGLQEQCAKPVPAAPEGQSPGFLFVSTSLVTWTTANPGWFARDFQINDTVYRRLDPDYYAWLRSRMTLARTAANAGQLDRPAFDQLCERFSRIQEWALTHFGHLVLLRAMRNLDPRLYVPPRVEEAARRAQSTARGTEAHTLAPAAALVDAVRDRALPLGWTLESLYQAQGRLRFPFGPEYGLVCFLKSTDRIGEVTREFIEMIAPPPMEARRRFYNPDAEQPWLNPVRRQQK